jgi:hypothetical protein
MRRVVVLALAFGIAATGATAVRAAAPRYILVSGPGLARPVVLGVWDENLRFLSALLPARRAHDAKLARRPRYDLAFFWGVPARPVPTRPRDTNQHGWFYPRVGARPAVVDLVLGGERYPRLATPGALRILARHGIPVA